MIREWMEARASLKSMTRIAIALERIARVLEEGSQGGSTGLRSYYQGSGPEDATVSFQTDEDFALLEQLELKHPEAKMEEDLEELGSGL